MQENQNTPMTEAMYYVLLALQEPRHGYAMMETINEISNGRVTMGPGTLYGILKRLEKQNFIRLENSFARRKVYSITNAGTLALKEEFIRLSNMVSDGQSFFREEFRNETKN